MNRNAFTLSELLAVIAIMGILSIMLIPSIINIRKDYLQKTYESRKKLIGNAALDWASDNLVNVPANVPDSCNNTVNCSEGCSSACACTTVGYLIANGYLSGSDENKTVMTNPLTNESINNNSVCVRYDTNDVLTRKLISYMEE